MEKKVCIIEGCGASFLTRVGNNLCPLCMQTVYRWRPRGAHAIMQYKKTLAKRTHRMNFTVGDTAKAKSNIVQFKPREKQNLVPLRKRARK